MFCFATNVTIYLWRQTVYEVYVYMLKDYTVIEIDDNDVFLNPGSIYSEYKKLSFIISIKALKEKMTVKTFLYTYSTSICQTAVKKMIKENCCQY